MRQILPALLLLAGAANAEHWTRIDYDADLRTMLIDTGSIKHQGTHALVSELQVEGRTAATRGDQFHTLVQRDFDCAAGTGLVTSVTVFPNLKSPGETLPIPAGAIFKIDARSITGIELSMACNAAPAPKTTVEYGSIAEAVENAFADAVKLPASDSNRTNSPMFGPGSGPPPGAGVAKLPAPPPKS